MMVTICLAILIFWGVFTIGVALWFATLRYDDDRDPVGGIFLLVIWFVLLGLSCCALSELDRYEWSGRIESK